MDAFNSGLKTDSEASTWGWDKRVIGFIAGSLVGAVCMILGVYMISVPLIGRHLFVLFYSLGNVRALRSTMFLMGPREQLKMMWDQTRVLATTSTIACSVLTLCAALWWESFGLSWLFCILQVFSFIWYSLSYIPYLREAIQRIVEICSEILCKDTKFLMWLLDKMKSVCGISGMLVTIVCLALALFGSFGLAALFGGLQALMLTLCNPSFIPSVGDALRKMVGTCSDIISDGTKCLRGALKSMKRICGKMRQLATRFAGLAIMTAVAFCSGCAFFLLSLLVEGCCPYCVFLHPASVVVYLVALQSVILFERL